MPRSLALLALLACACSSRTTSLVVREDGGTDAAVDASTSGGASGTGGGGTSGASGAGGTGGTGGTGASGTGGASGAGGTGGGGAGGTGGGGTSGAGGTGGGTSGAGGTSGGSGAGTGGAATDGGPLVASVAVDGAPFPIRVLGVDATARLTRAFEVDVLEVSVGRVGAWLAADRPVPCTSASDAACALDPAGPYAAVMRWRPEWNVAARDDRFGNADCDGPLAYPGGTTMDIGTASLPATCVSWYQAVAICAFEGKRLLTQVEWLYVSTGHGQGWRYAWGSTPHPPDCAHATFRDQPASGCGFPLAGGSAAAGASVDGLLDLNGSVFEWVWDAEWSSFPAGEADFSGPAFPATGDPTHMRHGGAFAVPDFAGDQRLENGHPDQHPANERYDDAGFRCARTLP